MAVIGINYNDGGNPLNYKSVYIHHGFNKKKDRIFDSGDFIRDWYDAMKYYIQNQEKFGYLSGSSSCNHFQMDGAKFDSAYLHIVDGNPVLKYVDTTEENWSFLQRGVYEKGIEFFVGEGMKLTWEELREYCGDKKREE